MVSAIVMTDRDHALAAVRAAFCAVLGADAIDDDSDLFALGGDSLALVEVVLEMEERLGVELSEEPLRPMLEAERCTVGELAAVVEQALGASRR